MSTVKFGDLDDALARLVNTDYEDTGRWQRRAESLLQLLVAKMEEIYRREKLADEGLDICIERGKIDEW